MKYFNQKVGVLVQHISNLFTLAFFLLHCYCKLARLLKRRHLAFEPFQRHFSHLSTGPLYIEIFLSGPFSGTSARVPDNATTAKRRVYSLASTLP